jgi:hypothetical protein
VKLISSFFEIEGPRCVFFTYQTPFKKSSDGSGHVEMTGAPKEFVVSTGMFKHQLFRLF